MKQDQLKNNIIEYYKNNMTNDELKKELISELLDTLPDDEKLTMFKDHIYRISDTLYSNSFISASNDLTTTALIIDKILKDSDQYE